VRAERVEEVIAALDRGELRVAEPDGEDWRVNGEAQEAILEYFRLRQMEPQEVGPFEYHDKIPLKRGYEKLGVRVVPPAVARYGSFLSPGVVMMPSYVNIGAWVGPRTMVDTWATVGSCAQIGADVHLSGGVGIGGVLRDLGEVRPEEHRQHGGGKRGVRPVVEVPAALLAAAPCPRWYVERWRAGAVHGSRRCLPGGRAGPLVRCGRSCHGPTVAVRVHAGLVQNLVGSWPGFPDW